MEVYPFLHGYFLVAFCGSLESVQRDDTAGRCGGFRFGEHGCLLFLPPDAKPAESGFDLRHALSLSGSGAGTEGHKSGAGVFFAQAVLEAVLSVASGTVDSNGGEGVDVGLAGWGGALRAGKRCWFLAWKCRGRWDEVRSFPSCGSPFASAGACVSGFGAMVHAKGVFARLAAEGEKVELMAVGVLAVCANGIDVIVHCGKTLEFGRRSGG